MPEHHPLLVVGAGLGGLTLARVLALHGVGCTVLDRDADRDARSQGGMLDLHEDTAQAALREAGLYEGFRRLVQPGGEATRVLDRHATVHHADDAEGGRPEVHRAALRDLLLDALPAGTVRWGAQVTAATPLGGGRHEVRLADGTTLTTDLLVGADGAWSRVRPLVSDAAPAYTGVSFVEADLTDADRRHPRAAALVGSGLLFALDQGKGLLAHREPGARLHTYVALRCPAELLDSLGLADRAAARRRVLAHFDGWDEGLRSLLADGDGPLVARPVHALPVTANRAPACTPTSPCAAPPSCWTPSASPTGPPPAAGCSPTSTAGTRACAPSSPTATARSSPVPSTPCPSATAGSALPASPCSATPPTSCPRSPGRAPTSPCSTAPNSPRLCWPVRRTPSAPSPRTRRPSSPAASAPPASRPRAWSCASARTRPGGWRR
ncbi:FAD-dependent monooxygenase [Streptomyces diastaticus]|uniref:FAD-dependent oxidoreductase n=1 Tax=Streptomyces diastaticus TaxID=1956 RepID=UPI003F4F0DC5